eukprot:Plantae.Rhodophyta-Palmaria_palmata.ctg13848.p1 GENE.Plantae.Rhodophyta-Palmaria_palmata.ctg13848~~Plantae.Rhodophyta-Palmaria_palmata.ctg13848.p1  ORF type:complete len:181 (+),score=21.65 Plantae.Rhodophyta-Palmaria_palmata.ctg13848:67-609(+)
MDDSYEGHYDWQRLLGGNRPQLENDQDGEGRAGQWVAIKSKAVMLIVNGLGDSLLRDVMTQGAYDPRKMRKKLQSRYFSTSETAQIILSTDLASKTLEPEGDVVNYMNELDGIYDRLEAMNEPTSDRSKIAKLLTSRPQEYEAVAAALRTSLSSDARTWHGVQDFMQNKYERMMMMKKQK